MRGSVEQPSAFRGFGRGRFRLRWRQVTWGGSGRSSLPSACAPNPDAQCFIGPASPKPTVVTPIASSPGSFLANSSNRLSKPLRLGLCPPVEPRFSSCLPLRRACGLQQAAPVAHPVSPVAPVATSRSTAAVNRRCLTSRSSGEPTAGRAAAECQATSRTDPLTTSRSAPLG